MHSVPRTASPSSLRDMSAESSRVGSLLSLFLPTADLPVREGCFGVKRRKCSGFHSLVLLLSCAAPGPAEELHRCPPVGTRSQLGLPARTPGTTPHRIPRVLGSHGELCRGSPLLLNASADCGRSPSPPIATSVSFQEGKPCKRGFPGCQSSYR